MSSVFVIINEWYDDRSELDLVELPSRYYSSLDSARDGLRELAATLGIELRHGDSASFSTTGGFERFYILELTKEY